MKLHLKFGSRVIDFTLHYRDRKSLGIKVYPEGNVEVLAPANSKPEKVIEKVRQKAPWILKQVEHFNSYKPVTPERKFVNGETHLYLGRQYRLKIIPNDINEIKLYRGRLWLYTRNTKREAWKQQLDKWYKNKAVIVFNELMDEVLPGFNRYNIKRPALIIRHMDKRWGSCTAAGKIILNAELIKAHKGSIEYVIVHELSHLVYRNHTKAFLNLQSMVLPDWRKWKDRLEHELA